MEFPRNKRSSVQTSSRQRSVTMSVAAGSALATHAQTSQATGAARTRGHRRGASMSSAQAQEQMIAGPSSLRGEQLPMYVARYPRRLARPYFPDIDDDAVRAEFPEFGDEMPLLWLREVMMPKVAVMMLDGISGCDIEYPTSALRVPLSTPLPSHLRITFPLTTPDEGACPTHILAVPPPPPPSFHPMGAVSLPPSGRYTLFPIHSAWIRVHCSLSPAFPPSATASGPGDFRRSAVLPVVEYPLPSPATFHALRTYMYNKDEQELYDYLVPQQRSRWATTFASADRQAGIIHGLWRNAAFMGLVDSGVWSVIENAWATVHPMHQELLARAKASE